MHRLLLLKRFLLLFSFTSIALCSTSNNKHVTLKNNNKKYTSETNKTMPYNQFLEETFEACSEDYLYTGINSQHDLLVWMGPTGSGKSTAINAVLQNVQYKIKKKKRRKETIMKSYSRKSQDKGPKISDSISKVCTFHPILCNDLTHKLVHLELPTFERKWGDRGYRNLYNKLLTISLLMKHPKGVRFVVVLSLSDINKARMEWLDDIKKLFWMCKNPEEALKNALFVFTQDTTDKVASLLTDAIENFLKNKEQQEPNQRDTPRFHLLKHLLDLPENLLKDEDEKGIDFDKIYEYIKKNIICLENPEKETFSNTFMEYFKKKKNALVKISDLHIGSLKPSVKNFSENWTKLLNSPKYQVLVDEKNFYCAIRELLSFMKQSTGDKKKRQKEKRIFEESIKLNKQLNTLFLSTNTDKKKRLAVAKGTLILCGSIGFSFGGPAGFVFSGVLGSTMCYYSYPNLREIFNNTSITETNLAYNPLDFSYDMLGLRSSNIDLIKKKIKEIKKTNIPKLEKEIGTLTNCLDCISKQLGYFNSIAQKLNEQLNSQQPTQDILS